MRNNLTRVLRVIGLCAFAAWALEAQDVGVGQWTRSAYHITAKGVYWPTFTTSHLNTLSCNVSNAGTAWILTVKTQEATPKVLWQWHTADGVGNFNILSLPIGIKMTSGIVVDSSGTTAGVADIELAYSGVPNPSATPFTTPTPTATATFTPTATATFTPTPTP